MFKLNYYILFSCFDILLGFEGTDFKTLLQLRKISIFLRLTQLLLLLHLLFEFILSIRINAAT